MVRATKITDGRHRVALTLFSPNLFCIYCYDDMRLRLWFHANIAYAKSIAK